MFFALYLYENSLLVSNDDLIKKKGKYMNLKRLLIGGIALTVCGSVNAATVFMSTDGSVNFFNINLASGSTLAMFDDNDGTFANALSIPLPSAVNIAPDGFGDFTATSTALPNNSITLTTNPWYILAVSSDGGASWTGDSFAACNSVSQSCSVSFADGTVLSVDAAIAAVPIPAAVWLFGSGLIGLVGVARRKKA
jgi:hypothetical protein